MLLPKPTVRLYAWACMLLAPWMLFCLAVAKVLICGLPFNGCWWSAAMWARDLYLMIGLYLMVGSTFGMAIEMYRHWALAERGGRKEDAEEEQTPFLRAV